MKDKRGIATSYVDEFPTRSRKLYEALDGDDDLGSILRAHIHIEHELREFVLAAGPGHEYANFKELGYDGTLQVALVLGLDSTLKAGLSAVGTLRNKFAHVLDMTLTKQDANNLYAAMSEFARRDLNTAYASLLRRPEYSDYPKAMKNLPAKQRVGMCVVHLGLRWPIKP